MRKGQNIFVFSFSKSINNNSQGLWHIAVTAGALYIVKILLLFDTIGLRARFRETLRDEHRCQPYSAHLHTCRRAVKMTIGLIVWCRPTELWSTMSGNTQATNFWNALRIHVRRRALTDWFNDTALHAAFFICIIRRYFEFLLLNIPTFLIWFHVFYLHFKVYIYCLPFTAAYLLFWCCCFTRRPNKWMMIDLIGCAIILCTQHGLKRKGRYSYTLTCEISLQSPSYAACTVYSVRGQNIHEVDRVTSCIWSFPNYAHRRSVGMAYSVVVGRQYHHSSIAMVYKLNRVGT